MASQDVRTNKPSRLPNFLILGAAKSGTTSLYTYLGRHPDVFMSSAKEPDFFVWGDEDVDIRGPGAEKVRKRIVNDTLAYRELFRGATHETALGEASTAYLYTPQASIRIREHIPEAKLIAILRNPIDRAYSAFLHARRGGYEPLSDFGEALAAEPARIRNRWGGLTHYTRVGMYAQQLDHYMANFPSHQMSVYLYEDMVRDPLAVAKDVFRFLDVDPTFEPRALPKHNEGLVVRNRLVHTLMGSEPVRSIARRFLPPRIRPWLYFRISRGNQLPIDPIHPELRTKLARLFEPEIHRLSHTLGRDLSPWVEDRVVSSPKQGVSVGMQPIDGS